MTAVELHALALLDLEIDSLIDAFERYWRARGLPDRTVEVLTWRAPVEATACRNRFIGALPRLAAECAELAPRR